MLYQLEKSKSTYYIQASPNDGSFYDRRTRTIFWNPTSGLFTNEGHELSPTTILNHEIDHALQHDRAPQQMQQDAKEKDDNYGNMEEKRVITGSEQKTAQRLGEITDKEVTRKDHGGMIYTTTNSTTTEWKNPLIIKPINEDENK